MTNVGHDVLDWFKIQWEDEDQTRYKIDDEVKTVQLREERYLVKGGKEVVEQIKYTDYGPVIPSGSGWTNHEGLALRWLAHDIPDRPELDVFRVLTRAADFSDFSKALDNYIAPAQNFAFASTDGSIGLRVNGRFPVKLDQEGRFIKDGSQSISNWQSYIPMDQIPQVYNPERQFVSSANQHSTSPNYPYYYNGSFEDYRGRAINEMLSEMENVSVEDMKKMQQNTLSVKARDVLGLLINTMNDRDDSDFWRRGFECVKILGLSL